MGTHDGAARRWAIVGAGISGLACASRLARLGQAVVVFDKGRGPGGRMATRRQDGQQFDHGAQFFTVRTPAVARAIDNLHHAGSTAAWWPCREFPSEHPRWVGSPRMTSIAEHLAQGLDVRQRIEIAELAGTAGHYTLRDTQGRRHGPFVGVLTTAPGPQSARLLAPLAPRLARACSEVAYTPCWVAMLAFAEPLNVRFDWYDPEHGPLQRLVRDSSKPGRPEGERWVVHANPRYSTEHLEETGEQMLPKLIEAAWDVWAPMRQGPRPELTWANVHRFRYARVQRAVGRECLWDGDLQLGVAGDGLLGARVEDAWCSGLALATAATLDTSRSVAG